MLRKASSVTKRTSTTVLLGAADSFAELVAARVIGAFPHKPNVADVVLRDCLKDERPRRGSVTIFGLSCNSGLRSLPHALIMRGGNTRLRHRLSQGGM